MNYISLKISCIREPLKHAKILRIGDMRMGQVETYAEMLCGESPYFVNAPGPQSPIGRCAVCGAKLEWSTMEATDDAQPTKSSDRAYRIPAKGKYRRGRPADRRTADDAGTLAGQSNDADQPAGRIDDAGRSGSAVLQGNQSADAAGEPS